MRVSTLMIALVTVANTQALAAAPDPHVVGAQQVKRHKGKYRANPPDQGPSVTPAPVPPVSGAAPSALVPLVPSPLVQTGATDESTATLLARARRLYDNLDYEKIIPLVNAVLERADAT